MPSPALVWPNIERLTIAWLTDRTGLPVYTETPPKVPDVYVRVQQVGVRAGEFDRTYSLDVHVHAPDRATLWPTVADVETALEALAATGNHEGYVDDVEVELGFGDVPPPDRDDRHAFSTYSLTVRPTAP